jgi:hypothetical protein
MKCEPVADGVVSVAGQRVSDDADLVTRMAVIHDSRHGYDD